MDYLQVFEIGASGLDVQKARLEAAARNLANMRTIDGANGMPYQPVHVVSRQAKGKPFELMLTGAQATGVKPEIVRDTRATHRLVYEPGNPHADRNGMVRYPGVDHLEQMVTINDALRAYQANIAVLHAAKTMAAHALEIGGN